MNNDGLTLNQLAERNAVLVTEVEKLSAERDQLAAENVELKSFGGTLHEIKSSLVGGGHGHMAKADMQAQSAVMDVIFDAFDAIETPATDSIVAGIKADGVMLVKSAFEMHIQSPSCYQDEMVGMESAMSIACQVESQLREGPTNE
ncbi:hypothetical protein [Klebsiella michiganensis]|uniref:hypothetical protein n=1 Tax=Klebsiella michiganensis TaxID=1134687 RepID=UPI0039842609